METLPVQQPCLSYPLLNSLCITEAGLRNKTFFLKSIKNHLTDEKAEAQKIKKQEHINKCWLQRNQEKG